MKSYVFLTVLTFVVMNNFDKSSSHPTGYSDSDFESEIEQAGYSDFESEIEHIKDHVKEHLNDTVDYDKMSEREYLMGYFRTHDTDENDKLDGVEMVHALTDHLHAEKSHRKSFTDPELGFFIDLVLEKYDVNNDGVLDIGEYMISQIKKKVALSE